MEAQDNMVRNADGSINIEFYKARARRARSEQAYFLGGLIARMLGRTATKATDAAVDAMTPAPKARTT